MGKDPKGGDPGLHPEPSEEGFDESEELTEAELVTLVDEDGNESTYAMLALVEVEDHDYVLLAPLEQLADDEGEELELLIFGYEQDDDGIDRFLEIEDESTYEKVRDFCATLFEMGALDLEQDDPGWSGPVVPEA